MQTVNYYLLGQRIRAVRNKKGLTQMALAERIETSPAYISYIETAYKSCSLDKLIQIANELNVSADELLIDSLENTIKVTNHEFASVLTDCTEYEMRVLLDIITTAKNAMRGYRYLKRSSHK